MKHSLFPSFLLPLLLTACGSPFSDAPPVADSTLVSALAELHLAEARLSLRQQERSGSRREATPDTARVPLPPALRDSILSRHGMSYRQLRAAIRYYARYPEQYTQIYDRVVDTLNAEREALRFDGPRPGTPPAERPTPPAFQ